MSEFDHLIPVRSQRKHAGWFSWPDKATLTAPRAEDRTGLEELAGEVKVLFGTGAIIHLSAQPRGTLRLIRTPAIPDSEGYRLTVAKDGVRIESRSDAGAYYGLQTLRELLRMHGRNVPCCRIDDAPAFKRRGVYLDCSRGKVPTVETLKGLIRFLARLKVNELQLYIENVFTFARHPKIGRGFSPFRPEELLDLQAYCEAYHVNFVPSLSSFGHLERILTLPEYSALGENPGYRGLPGGTTLCPTDPRSIRLVGDLYDEFLPLFKNLEFNACCDETFGLGEGRSHAIAKKRGASRLYLEFILQLHGLCARHGKRMNLWADIVLNHPGFLKELPKDIVLLNWEYDPDGANIGKSQKLQEAGLPYLACPGVHSWLSHGTRLEYAMRNIRKFTAAAGRHGAQGILNTDWGDLGHRQPLAPSFHGYAYGAAHAWSGGGRRVDDKRFTRNFCFHVFGERKAGLASQIRTLGSVQKLAKQRIYWALGESLLKPRQLLRGIPRLSPSWIQTQPDCINEASGAGCERALASLEGCTWSGFEARPSDAFIRTSFDDFETATCLDRLALSRVLAGKRLRSGKQLPEADAKALQSLAREARTRLESNWLQRNRPSRLKDSLRLLDNTVAELSDL